MNHIAQTVLGRPVRICEADLDTDVDIDLHTASDHLSAEERARAAEFVFEQDRARYVRAHGLLRRELASALGLAPRDVPIATAENGKPFLEGIGLQFNLSHSGSRVVFAFSEHADIGVDVELEARDGSLGDQLEGLSELCMTGYERTALRRAPAAGRVRRFLRYWTAKEARMKLTGEGMALDPRDIRLALAKGEAVGYRAPASPDAALRFVSLSHPGAICCLAIARR